MHYEKPDRLLLGDHKKRTTEILGVVGKLKMSNKSGKKNEIQKANIELIESDCAVANFFYTLEETLNLPGMHTTASCS